MIMNSIIIDWFMMKHLRLQDSCKIWGIFLHIKIVGQHIKRDVEVLGIYIKKAFSDQFYPYDVICDIFPHFIMCVYWILTDVPAI